MSEAFICEGTRTPIGRFGGSLSSIRTDDLASLPLIALKENLAKADWDSLEEVFENKEQIEVSKFYEKLPKSYAIAVEEWLEDKIYHRNTEEPNS